MTVTGSRGHGANSRGTGRHGADLPWAEFCRDADRRSSPFPCVKGETHTQKDLKVHQESVSGMGQGNDGGGFPKITGEAPQWVRGEC